MKNSILLLGLMMCLISNAQEKIKVDERPEKIGGGVNNALVAYIYSADKSTVEKNWKGEVKGYGAKVSMKKEIFADNASIKSISDNDIDIYCFVEEEKEALRLVVAFDLGGAFLSAAKHPDKYRYAEKIVLDFALNETKSALEDELKVAEKVYEKLEKKGELLIKENENLHKSIERYKEQIKTAEDNIVTNDKEQEENKKELEAQKKVVESIKTKQSKVN